eukprot:GHVU01099051.1.p1 GENE.GHVU01099051.1~~GHVU01099051.1.p1  ORF type:complete len:169 (-),score=21.68 GHVU01099051.1:20-526(-)
MRNGHAARIRKKTKPREKQLNPERKKDTKGDNKKDVTNKRPVKTRAERARDRGVLKELERAREEGREIGRKEGIEEGREARLSDYVMIGESVRYQSRELAASIEGIYDENDENVQDHSVHARCQIFLQRAYFFLGPVVGSSREDADRFIKLGIYQVAASAPAVCQSSQ